MRQELPGAGGDGLGDRRLVPQPGPPLLRTRACLTFRPRGPVEPSARPASPFTRSSCVRTWSRASISVCRALAPSAASRSRTAVSGSSSTGISSATASRSASSSASSTARSSASCARAAAAVLRSASPAAPRACPASRPNCCATDDFSRSAARRRSPSSSTSAARSPLLGGPVLRRAEFLAPHGELLELGSRLVDGRLHLEEAGRPGGPTVREVRSEQVPSAVTAVNSGRA